MYESLSTNGTNYFSDVMKKQMLQNALNDVDDFRNIHTVGRQTGNATTFEEYKALVHSAADVYDKKSRAKKHATHTAYSHDLDAYDPVEYLYDGYDLNTDIDTIYANTADTHEGMISSDPFCQMTPEGHKMWISLPDLLKTGSSSLSKTHLPHLLSQTALGVCMDRAVVEDVEPLLDKEINPAANFVSIFMIHEF